MPSRTTEFAIGNYYHLYNRGVGRQSIFLEPGNYEFALRRIKKYAREFDIAVVAYCLMPNHYHLLVRQDADEPAGRLTQLVFNSYTKAFNKQQGRSGTLFEGRYKSIHVDRDEYLLHLCRYIHANPVKAGLVARLDEWPYSNYLEWIGVRNGTLIDRAFVREFFPEPHGYVKFVQDYLAGYDALPDGIDMYLLD
ncbi:MAG: transposase [Anaerolineae bacterium]